MVEINYSKLREKCCYCFKGITNGISICECLLSFCEDHHSVHKNKINCKELFFVEKKDTVTVKGENLTEEEKTKIAKRMEIILKCKNYEDKVVFKEEEVECPHLKEETEKKVKIGKLEDLKCRDCPIKKQLYVCVTCGSLGCGRVQFGSEGNGHAMEHYKSTGHEVFILVQSITPEYTCDTFCYTCNDFIINPFCDHLLECEEFNGTVNTPFDIPKESVIESSFFSSPFLGIKNAGNTCYISSVLQLFGFVVVRNGFRASDHFDLCEYQNPLNCLYCQTARVFNEIQIKYNGGEEGGI